MSMEQWWNDTDRGKLMYFVDAAVSRSSGFVISLSHALQGVFGSVNSCTHER